MMKITMAQLNPVVGDLVGNIQRIEETLKGCQGENPDLVVFPELFLVGYPPKDLLEKTWFIDKCQQALEDLQTISARYPRTGILLGVPLPRRESRGKGLYNSAILIYQGRILQHQHKTLLPTYDVFDETRYFAPATGVDVVHFKGVNLGISICEDAWSESELWNNKMIYSADPIDELARKKADIMINLSASPFHVGKEDNRYRMVQGHARKHHIPFVYVNQVGANDELIFDGRSLAVDKEGEPLVLCPSFQEHVQTFSTSDSGRPGIFKAQDKTASIYQALVLGVRDYMHKCGFKKAVLGLSGGIDSALTCCIAAEAVGPENVLGVTMPSPFSSMGSVEDSRSLAKNLGIEFETIPISRIYSTYLETLAGPFSGTEPNETEENIQARIRGNILMAFSNKYGSILLSTGNKSEIAVGYCTLYGDMSGGLSVLADVPKTTVYQLSRFINREKEVIPWAIIEKPPSAELKPDQLDQDTLPSYETLDEILYAYVEEGLSQDEVVALGKFDPEIVQWVVQAVLRNEYKRHQAAPGLKVTAKAFGSGRRMPIAARHRYK